MNRKGDLRGWPASPGRALAGLATVGVATPLAIMCVPADHTPAGALFLPAAILTVGLLAVPAVAVFRQPLALFRADHLLMAGLVYWLLLDLLIGAYPLDEVGRYGVQAALAAVGLFAAGAWCAGLLRPWPLPQAVLRAARLDPRASTLFSVFLACFFLGMLSFAIPCGFDPFVMFSGLSGDRWSAPWSRDQLGGWGAFGEHLSYFGYLLPSLTVLLAHRRGQWLHPNVIVAAILSLVMGVFLAHGGSRRIIGVIFGSGLICWALLRARGTLRMVAILGGFCVLLLLAMELYPGIPKRRLWANANG